MSKKNHQFKVGDWVKTTREGLVGPILCLSNDSAIIQRENRGGWKAEYVASNYVPDISNSNLKDCWCVTIYELKPYKFLEHKNNKKYIC